MKPPSNAIEIPIQHIVFDDLTHCDGCNVYSNGARFKYKTNRKEIQTMLYTRVRKREIILCRSCNFAYGKTLQVNGYEKK